MENGINGKKRKSEKRRARVCSLVNSSVLYAHTINHFFVCRSRQASYCMAALNLERKIVEGNTQKVMTVGN